MKKVLFAVVICLPLLLACSKSDDEQKNNPTEKILKSNNQTLQRQSGTNFDDYHLIHNSTLDVFFNDINNNQTFYFSNASSQSKEDRGYEIVTNYIKSQISTDIDSEWLNAYFIAQKNCDYSENADFFRITESNYYTRLSFIIDNNTDPLIVDTKINFLISDLINDKDVSESDKIALKSAMLIGSQSFEYWTNNDSKWELLGVSVNAKAKGNKTSMMHADVEGAVSGAITGAMTGAPFAGAGAGAGALCGAMLGAAWGSAVSGAFSHFGIW